MKISFGMVTRKFDSLEPIEQFLDNAQKFGHEIYSVVIAYSDFLNWKLLENLKKRVHVFPIKINHAAFTVHQLSQMGVSSKSIRPLLYSPTFTMTGRVPYGFNRNCVLIKAILTGSDVLLFIDTDVYPKILIQEEDGKIYEKEIDFVGSHLAYLKEENVCATTSDYSGYYIIPPMNFKGMQELLIGLQKEDVYEYMLESHRHHCLNLRNDPNPSPFETNKILGGNLAIKLEALENIPPFFSSAYTVGGETVLTRGEDTLWGLAFQNAPVKCIDIDAPIFHDTYNSYPDVPDILRDKSVQDRFYHACLGWIGRNPFLNWKSGKNLEECKAVQLKNIEIGAKALAKYTDNERFLMLPQALQISYDRIHHVIQQYNELQNAWDELIQKLKEKGRRIHEDIDRQSFSV